MCQDAARSLPTSSTSQRYILALRGHVFYEVTRSLRTGAAEISSLARVLVTLGRPLCPPRFPPAWLVGSTTATRTAFRVLWRPIRAAISVSVWWLPLPSGLIEREFRDASIKPLRGGSRPILTKIVVFPLGCPDTLVWGARAAKFPRDRLRCPTRWLGRPEPNLAFIGGVFGPTRVHVENADHT